MSRTMVRIAAALLLLAAAASTGCQRARGTNQPVRLGVAALRISLPVFVAAREGIFERHGLEVELAIYETAQPLVQEVIEGRLDAGGYAAYPIILLASHGARQPPVVATTLIEDAEHRLSYALGRVGAGLHFPADAAGKTIGILPTIAYQRWLVALLQRGGIDPATVDIVLLAPGLQAQALTEGGVDMLFTNDPAATAALATGRAEIIDDGPPCAAALADPFDFGAFVLNGSFVARDPGRAARLVAAIDEAIDRTHADPAAALRAMLHYLPPEQRSHAGRFPRSRYLTSEQTGADRLPAEVARERALGILDEQPEVIPWSPQPIAPTSPR